MADIYRYTAKRVPSPEQLALVGAESEALLVASRPVSATIEAMSTTEVIEWLESRSMRPLHVTKVNVSVPDWLKTKPEIEVYLMFFRGLVSLLKPTGSNAMSKRSALSTLTDQIRHPSFREATAGVLADVEAGSDLGSAMARRPNDFEPLHAALVSAGEKGGAEVLWRVLGRIVTMIVKNRQTMGKIVSALIEPGIIFISFIVLILFFVATVAPMLKSTFEAFNTPVPAGTLLFISIGTLMTQPLTWLVVVSSVAGVVIAYRRYASTESGRRTIDNIRLNARLSIPLVVRTFTIDLGVLFRYAIQARILRMLGTLLTASVPIHDALDTCIPLAGSPLYADALRDIRAGRELGDQLAVLMKETGVFEPIVVDYLAISARAASIDIAMLEMAADLDEYVDLGVDRFTQQIRPLLIIGLGALLAPVLVAMFGPFYTLAANAASH